ncbi:MAG TPA: FHA domain-containing protein [Chloroflexi bacterium]|nr:FHA domain-containing protein [Chloroflexota bacterium]
MTQLEVISPGGQIQFYELDPGKGVLNIGRHVDNDVVIDAPGVSPFHAIIDYRQRPYHLVVLSHEGNIRLNGQKLIPNTPVELNYWDSLEIAGFTLLLVEGQAAPSPVPAAAAGAAAVAAVAAAPEAPVDASQPSPPLPHSPTPSLNAPVPNIGDDVIVVEVTEREWTLDVEQSASTLVTIINGGAIVAGFDVQVQGVPAEWVVVTPSTVNLNEGQRASVTVTITPPRASSSQAGARYFGIVVTSPDHPGRLSQTGAVLTINPYYEFSVSDLSPKRQTLSWRKQMGQVSLSLGNKGNSQTDFEVEGADDERACSFEFRLPDQDVSLANRAEFALKSQETASISVDITPRKRSTFGLRKKLHAFTITARQTEGEGFPYSLLGQLYTKPVFGMLHLILFLILLAIGVYLFFQPRITEFYAEPPVTRAGREVTLSWNTFPSPLVTLTLNHEPMEHSVGSAAYRPIEDAEYHLSASTLLSEYLPFLPYPHKEKTIEVVVTPVRPTIRLFEASRNLINQGDTIILSWLVSEADTEGGLNLTYEVGGEDVEAQKLESNAGSVALLPQQNTTYRLEAIHPSSPNAPQVQWASVEMVPTVTPTFTPMPTPIPPPVIDFFIVEPETITAGEVVNLSWHVRGVDTVSVQTISPDPLPAISPPDIINAPAETTLYVLTANNGGGAVQAVKQVIVQPAVTPTPEAAPVIEVFTITPEEGVSGEKVDARLDWFVNGPTTNIHITGGPKGFEPLANLESFGNAEIKDLDETAVFILTAINDETEVLKTVQILFLEPTPTPEPEPGPPPEPDPEITRFIAAPLSSGDSVTSIDGDPPTYEVTSGSNVDLQWETANADTVTLVGVGDQAPSGNYTIFNVRAGRTYQLIAQGPQASVDSTLRLTIVAAPPPPPPYNLNGAVEGSAIRLTWNYDAQQTNNIIGFRIYRADVPPGNFTRVADENTLTNLTTQWTDTTLTETCGKGYYIVAVYIDATTGDRKETDASRYSWYSDPCP